MGLEGRLTLRERAVLTWRDERPQREAARLLWQAEKLEKVRGKLAGIVGPEHEIKIGINSKGDITARVEDLQFITYSYDEDLFLIVPVAKCPLCGKDVSLGYIEDLAELGEKLELLEYGYRHECGAYKNLHEVAR